MKKILTGLAVIILLGTCTHDMDNKAGDNGLGPNDFYGKITMLNLTWQENLLTPNACCGMDYPPTATDGPAAWAVNGITSNFWHTTYTENRGYPHAATNGHVGDTNVYIMAGDRARFPGYTWTQNPALAEGGPGNPWTVASVVPANGSHWITLDLGREVEIGSGTIGAIGYQRRPGGGNGQLGQANHSYEIYTSRWNFGWVVEGEPGINRLADGTIGGTNEYQYIILAPVSTVKFRYLQIRWRYTATVGATSRHASASDINFRIAGPELDYEFITTVYQEGRRLLRSMVPSNRQYHFLQLDLARVEEELVREIYPEELETPAGLLAAHMRLNGAATTLLARIYRINPPPRPPEVQL